MKDMIKAEQDDVKMLNQKHADQHEMISIDVVPRIVRIEKQALVNVQLFSSSNEKIDSLQAYLNQQDLNVIKLFECCEQESNQDTVTVLSRASQMIMNQADVIEKKFNQLMREATERAEAELKELNDVVMS